MATVQTGAVDSGSRRGGNKTTLSLRLENPHTLCYVNACILALLHVGDALGLAEERLESLRTEIMLDHGRFGREFSTDLRQDGMLDRDNRMLRSSLSMFWGASKAAAFGSPDLKTMMGCATQTQVRFFSVRLSKSSSTLQELIEAWTFQRHVRSYWRMAQNSCCPWQICWTHEKQGSCGL